jgi:hypothetical protein
MTWWPQPLPEDVLATLRMLRRTARAADTAAGRREAWGRFLGYVDALKSAGWRETSLSRPLGVTHEALRQVRLDYSASPADPAWPVPPGPRRPPREPAGPPRKYLSAQQISELNALRRRSSRFRGPVRGTDRENDPDWAAGREFAARVHELVGEGHSVYGIAADLGVANMSVRNRLARHGYREFVPSQAPKFDPPRTRAAS